jgi:hypothetical protein
MWKGSGKAIVLFVLAGLPMAGHGASHEVYAKAGLIGAGVGYAHGVGRTLTLRADISSAGRIRHNFKAGDVSYRGKLRNDQAMVYTDWFPLNNGFRLTAGVGIRNTRDSARGWQDGNLLTSAGTPAFTSDDYVDAQVKYPRFAPYLGIGWGHNVAQQTKGGWGFIVDAGVTFGRPSVNYSPSASLANKLSMVSPALAQRELDKRAAEFEDKAYKWRVVPSVYVGISYAF